MESTFEKIDKLLKSKIKGDAWIIEALPVVVGIGKETKEIEERKKTECVDYNESIKKIRESYAPSLDVLKNMDLRLRERIDKEHKGTDTVRVDGVGQAIFPSSWGFEIKDTSKVDRKYLTVDSKKVMEDINKGLRKIGGLEIEQQRGLRILPEKE